MISLLTQCDESEPVILIGFDGEGRAFKQTTPRLGLPYAQSWDCEHHIRKTFDAARVALNNEGAF